MTKEEVKRAYEGWQGYVQMLRKMGTSGKEREEVKAKMERAKGSFLSLLPAYFAFGEMSISDFSSSAKESASYPGVGGNVMYPILGMTNTVGRMSAHIQSMVVGGGRMTEEVRKRLTRDLGGILWHVAMVAHELSTTMDDVARKEIERMKSEGPPSGEGTDG